jgi:two-component system NarL family sensor kinase
MQRIYVVISLIISCCTPALAQKDVADLIAKLNQATGDSARIHCLNELAFAYVQNPDSAWFYATLAEDLSLKVGNQKGLSRAMKRKGMTMKYHGEYDSALYYYREALPIEITFEDPEGLASVFNNIAIVYKRLGAIDSALSYHTSALELRLQLDSIENIADSYVSIGAIFRGKRDYADADSILHLALSYSEQVDYVKGMANANLNLGNLYAVIDSTELATMHWGKAYEQYGALPMFQGSQVSVASNLGSFLIDNGEALKGIQYLYDAFVFRSEKRDMPRLASVALNIGNGYFQLAQYDSSQKYLEISTYIADSLGHQALLLLNYELLAQLYDSTGKTNLALHFFQRYHFLSDSLNSLEKEEQYQRIKEQFGNNALTAITQNQAKEIAQQASKERQLVAALLGLLVVALLVVLFLRQRHRSKLQLSQKETEIAQHNSLIEGQEMERERIGQDLHDSLGAVLSATKHQLAAVDSKLNKIESHYQEFSKASKMLDEAVDEVRRISHNMINKILVEFGLTEALHDLAETMQGAKNLEIKVQDIGFEENERLDPKVELMLYRIAQEALQNTLKHAEASEVMIRLHRKKEHLQILIKDDGNGFDVQAGGEGVGLRNIKTRVEFLQGQLVLESTPNSGCSIKITVPLS